MKKIIYMLILVCSLLMFGCGSSSDNKKPEDKLIEKQINYNIDDLSVIILEYQDLNINLSSNNVVRNLLFSIKYYENTNSTKKLKLEYIVHLKNDKHLYIYSNGTIGVEKINESEIILDTSYMIINNEFDVFKDILEGEELKFEFDTSSSITVFNYENTSVQIKTEDKEDFLKNLDNIKYYKLKNKSQYTLGAILYKINIEEKNIEIYNDNLLVVDGEMFIVVKGNFDFLNDIKFNTSSGYLPWV